MFRFEIMYLKYFNSMIYEIYYLLFQLFIIYCFSYMCV